MADRLRMIAVCLSEAHSFLNTGFLNELGRAAAEKGYGVAVFNSSLDLRWYQEDNPAPRSPREASSPSFSSRTKPSAQAISSACQRAASSPARSGTAKLTTSRRVPLIRAFPWGT